MLKSNFYFKLGLIALTCLLHSTIVSGKDLDFSATSVFSCKSDTQQYVINYDNVGSLEWIVEGGYIISLDGRDERLTSQEMFKQYMGGQWYTVGSHNVPFDAKDTYSYTRIKFDGNKRMEVTCVISTTAGPRLFDGSDRYSTHTPTLSNNPLKKITVVWSANAFKRTIKCKGDGLGAIGFLTGETGEVQKTIQLYKPVPNFSIHVNNPNSICNQAIQLDGVPYDDTYYTNAWNVPNGIISNNWNSGIYIERFTDVGTIPVTVSISNVCGENITKSVDLFITQPDFGHVTQGTNNVDVPGSLVTLDCQGNFTLNMPLWVSSTAVYSWELPGASYDSQTNTYTKTVVSGVNKQTVQGKLPAGGLTDFVASVSITGVCGKSVDKTVIVRPALRASVDAEIYTCSTSVSIPVNNPTGTSNVNAWVTFSTPLYLQSTITNQTASSFKFTAANPGVYHVNIGVNGAGGCYTQLQTVVHIAAASANSQTHTAGWQSGVLSDNRKAPGSNIFAYGGNIYFAGRDGKIYYYSFSNAIQKWSINEIPGITNASIPASGAFTNIGVALIGTERYVFFTNNDGKFMKVNLTTNTVDDGVGITVYSNNFTVANNEVYVFSPATNGVLSSQGVIVSGPNITLKTPVAGYGVCYLQNNNLYVTGIGQLTTSADVYPGSDVVYYNGWLYYARGQKGSANLYRMQINNPSVAQQITSSTNASGIFSINPASGVIYYGVMNLGAANTIGTQTSGTYKAAEIYQAHLTGTAWVSTKATTAVNPEGMDMFIHSAVYNGNHLYYVGAGHTTATGGAIRELEVWNLYYENACAPVLQRVGGDIQTEAPAEVLVYPNPFNTHLFMDLSTYTLDGNVTAVGAEIIDAAGKSVYQATVLSELTTISTEAWAPGMYLVKITHNNTVVNKKTVKY